MSDKNMDNKITENNNAVNDSVVAGDIEPVIIIKSEEEKIENSGIIRSEEEINMDKFVEKMELASFFPSLEERCISISRIGIKPLPDINTGALASNIRYEAGMDLLSAIKKEIFDSKPEWEKECIKEGRIAGARLEDESFEDDGVTPQDGRPRLTVEYLRSIGYDIDIS